MLDEEKIYKSLNATFKGCASKVYDYNRPTATPQAVEDFLVLDLDNNIDYGAYEYCTFTIFIFVKDNKGLAQGKRIEEIKRAVLGKFPLSNAIFKNNAIPRQVQSEGDGQDFHYVRILTDLIIFK